MNQWIDLSLYWDWLERTAERFDAEKRRLAGNNRYRLKEGARLVGLAGELCYALETGQAVNTEIHPEGDKGMDFPDHVDVKTSTFLSDPLLKHEVNPHYWPEHFAFVVLDQLNRRARLVGIVGLRELMNFGEVKDFGYGNRYTLPEKYFTERIEAVLSGKCQA